MSWVIVGILAVIMLYLISIANEPTSSKHAHRDNGSHADSTDDSFQTCKDGVCELPKKECADGVCELPKK